MKILFFQSLLILFSIFLSSSASAESRRVSFFEEQFLGVTLGTDTQNDLEEVLGEGEAFGEMKDMVCYFNENLSQRVIFSSREDKRVDSVRVVSYAVKIWRKCRKTLLNKTPATPKDIALGVSKQFVINIYGEPQSKSTDKNGDELFEYHATDKDDPRIDYNFDSYLTFKDGKLIDFEIGHGP